MASSSGIKRLHVFTSFHGQDVRRGFLSHLHSHFESKGITTFNDQEIERGHSIAPELVSAIRESRVLLVLLSKNYASSGWCLDELVEIMKCKEDLGQPVMTIFYQVDPSSVRKQKGDFGSAFMKTCQGKAEEVKLRWIKALTDVANIEGEHSLNWSNEAEMIKKIATDVSNKLNVTPSRDFVDGMVGLEAHLTNLNTFLRLECDDVVKMIGIWGPAGIEELEVLAKEPSWFGPGSRIIVATEDINILRAHDINDIYNVDFPSENEAIEILCLSAFKGASVQDGFEELAKKVAGFCSSLPLALDVVGKSLRGQSKNEWERQLSKLETSLDGSIENALKVGYKRLSTKDQALFLHIACFFFFCEDVDHLTNMLADCDLDVGNGLKTLADKSLVHISYCRGIVMHSLLQKLGRQIVVKQSDDPGKRQFLVDPKEIRHVLAAETGTDSLIEDLEYLPSLRLLDWNSYPRKSLPASFQPERLVELNMQFSNLEKLWDEIHPLASLKKIDLDYSYRLKEIPDLSNATNLETLSLSHCSSLVELPYSIKNLHKLKKLKMRSCEKLRVIPTNINLASLKVVDMRYCSQLGIFPDISSNIKILSARDTKIKDIPASVVGRWSRCRTLKIGSKSLERLTHIPVSVTSLDLINSDIKRIPDCIIDLPHLVDLIVENCTKLVSIPALPPSLKSLNANNCVSLKTVHCSFHSPINVLTFYNCLKLDEEARRGIIQQSVHGYLCLPAKEVPAEFTHKATGKSITIPLAPGGEATFSAPSRFKACVLLSPVENCRFISIICHLNSKEGVKINSFFSNPRLGDLSPLSEHLFIFGGDLVSQRDRGHEVDVATSEITFEFSCSYFDDKIIECGVQILTEDAKGSSNTSQVDYFNTERSSSEVENFETESNSSYLSDDLVEAYLTIGEDIIISKHTSRWSWLEKLGLKKKKKIEKTWHIANFIIAALDSKT
ncbi:hypothetical protein AALP_AA8G239800 [Arabis alpina]|uniref:TIR domain-containing protein n=1 Tax=Arabis alpina TaxID=50452 RepID=A0A087G919_ARAAL|nr:hypothetical protein AALP_AA8G239800 [Arabis alpina]